MSNLVKKSSSTLPVVLPLTVEGFKPEKSLWAVAGKAMTAETKSADFFILSCIFATILTPLPFLLDPIAGAATVAYSLFCWTTAVVGCAYNNYHSRVDNAKLYRWVLKRRLKKSNRKQGWLPRSGLKHPKGRKDRWNRSLVNIELGTKDNKPAYCLYRWDMSLGKNNVWGHSKKLLLVSFDEDTISEAFSKARIQCQEDENKAQQEYLARVDHVDNRQLEMSSFANGLNQINHQ